MECRHWSTLELLDEYKYLRIEPLALHPEHLPLLREWLEAEWPPYYGADGPGDALSDLQAFSTPGSLPIGVIALSGDRVCGLAALKAESIASHRHLSPWAASGLVDPALRAQGIGGRLLGALEQQAQLLGVSRIYCGTSTAETLLQRCGWQLMERIVHEVEGLGIYSKELP